MTDKFRASDATEWNSHGHIGRGKIRKKLTRRTLLKGHAYLGDAGSGDGREDEAGSAPRAGAASPARGGAPDRAARE